MDRQACVALIGPRQVGKTTLALDIANDRPSVYLDLEAMEDRARLGNPVLFLEQNEERLVILDEIHRAPELFQTLRGIIDKGRRKGLGTGRFLILGSASIDLLRQSGESLAGRITYIDMDPLKNLVSSSPARTLSSFYRTAAGAEIDLVLELPNGKKLAIEIKNSMSPNVGKGFFNACEDIEPDRSFIVYSGAHRYPKTQAIDVISLKELALELR